MARPGNLRRRARQQIGEENAGEEAGYEQRQSDADGREPVVNEDPGAVHTWIARIACRNEK